MTQQPTGIVPVSTPATTTNTSTTGHARRPATANQTSEARSFLDWLSFGGGEGQVQQAAHATVLEELNPSAAPKRPLIWETPAALRNKAPVAMAVVTSAVSSASAAEKSEAEDRTRSILADELDSDDLALLQQVVGTPNPQLMAWFLPQSLPRMQAWTDASGQAVTEGITTGGGRLSGQMERLLKWSAASGKSVRVMIDDSLAVVLRIRQGRVSADFVPQGVMSQEVASRLAALQSQLDSLRQRLSDQQLPVDEVRARLPHGYDQPQQQQPRHSDPDPSEENTAS